MSKTPRTYAHCKQIIDDALGLEYAATELQYWAEKLEEELSAAQAEIATLREKNIRMFASAELAEAQRDEKDKQLADCYDRMFKAEARSNLLACALRALLLKCPDCGGIGWVGTGIIQIGQPDQMPCFVCAGERQILLRECGK